MRRGTYAVIDLKSFYASCECACRGLDIFSTPLVVADPTRSANTIVMSTTPYLKEKYGVPNVCRVKSLPDVPGMICAKPRMAYYLQMSAKVVSIFLDFLNKEDIHVYSVDESFLYLTPYLKMYDCSEEELCRRIIKRIKDELGLVATCGLGPNMFLAKICLDNEGKKKPPYLARWTYDDVKTKLWSIRPITKIWGISDGISSHLYRLGIRDVESLAKASPYLLKREFGVLGQQLHDLANGIDNSDIREKYVPKERNISIGQTLMRDYDAKGCTGFSRQCSFDIPTDDNDDLYDHVMYLFDKFIEDKPIRGLGISFAKLSSYSYRQNSVFVSDEEAEERRSLHLMVDAIQNRFGKDLCLRASSLCKDSTIKQRHKQIGGHNA